MKVKDLRDWLEHFADDAVIDCISDDADGQGQHLFWDIVGVVPDRKCPDASPISVIITSQDKGNEDEREPATSLT